jgi:dTDP-4-amino-4,6-dideoxygalactose transaminase
MTQRLALHGGRPVRDPARSWPRWPELSAASREYVEETLASTRWAIFGPYQGRPSRNREFADVYARFHGVRYCTLTANGTSALTCSLEALGIGWGDEVIVPGLTWVAPASASLAVNAVPILADVDEQTLCISPATIEARLTPRTRAVIVVHAYSAVADMKGIMALAERRGFKVIEDCSQAHGAVLDGRRVGTFGHMSCFSMHQTKVLGSGEGGAILTDDADLHRRAEQLRADGRVVLDSPPPIGGMECRTPGDLMGNNFCLTELQAALLLGQFTTFEVEHRKRLASAAILDERLPTVGPYRTQATTPGNSERSHYQYVTRFEPEAFEGIPVATVAAALSAELGFQLTSPSIPLTRSPFYKPHSRRRFHLGEQFTKDIDPARFPLPVTERVFQCHVMFHHSLLLGSRDDLGDVVAAFEKVSRGREELRAAGAEPGPR